MANMVKAGF